MIQLGAKLEGDWATVRKLSNNLRNYLFEAHKQCLRQWSMKAVEVAKAHIQSQDLAWAPLQPSTIAKKNSSNRRIETLIETEQYLNAIKGWTDVTNGKSFAGIPEDATYRIKGKGSRGRKALQKLRYISFIARLHEYGNLTSNLPARPLWEPTAKEVMDWTLKSNRPEVIFTYILIRKTGMSWAPHTP